MKLISLLENKEPTLKDTMRFCMVLQDCLIESYPQFKTKIEFKTNSESFYFDQNETYIIKWFLADLEIEFYISTNLNFVRAFYNGISVIRFNIGENIFYTAETYTIPFNELFLKLFDPFLFNSDNIKDIPNIKSHLKYLLRAQFK